MGLENQPRNYYARILSAGSRVGQHLAPSINPANGSNSPFYRPVRWRYASQTDARSIDWLDYEPRTEGGIPRPRNFKAIAQLSIPKQAFREVKQGLDVHQAVAYKLGESAVMVGLNERGLSHKLFDGDPGDSDRYAVGMRIGRGVLHAAMGVYVPSEDRFIALHDEASRGDIVDFAHNDILFV